MFPLLVTVAVLPPIVTAGVPLRVSEAVKVTVATSPTLANALLALLDAMATEDKVGAMPSITMALLPPRELAVPTAGRVKMASIVKLSLIVPPFSSKAVVLRYSKFVELSPACTT